MRKLFLAVAILLNIAGATLGGTPEAAALPPVTEKESREAKELTQRLEVIRKLDKSEMSVSEKKELRREVREIRQKLRQIGGGIYLSAAAIIIIILLLILLL